MWPAACLLAALCLASDRSVAEDRPAVGLDLDPAETNRGFGPVTFAEPLPVPGTRPLGGSWSLLNPGTTPFVPLPAVRALGAFILDSSRSRIVIQGGMGQSSPLEDTWGFDLTENPIGLWHHIRGDQDPIKPRHSHVYAYDSSRQELVVIGGIVENQFFMDVWRLPLSVPGAAWQRLPVAPGPAPSPRAQAAAIYDPLRDRVIVFGGYDAQGLRSDTWALQLGGTATWSLLAASFTGPEARIGHAAAYDPVRDRMLVMGGDGGGFLYFRDLWALPLGPGSSWELVAPPDPRGPGARRDHAAAYDANGDRLLIHGGRLHPTLMFEDVWAYDLAASKWNHVTSASNGPGPRWGFRAVFDPASNRLLVFGGVRPQDWRNDIWALSLSGAPTWSCLVESNNVRNFQPSVRAGHAAIWDEGRREMVVFGGSGFQVGNEVWTLSPQAPEIWNLQLRCGLGHFPVPAFRSGHSAIYDPLRDRMIVFGGDLDVHDDYNYNVSPANDVWAWNLDGVTGWTELATGGPRPDPRTAHSAIYDAKPDRMIVFGGWNGATYFNDVWELRFEPAPTWERILPSGKPPPPLRRHVAIHDRLRDRMLVHGGEVSSYSPNTAIWELSLRGTPAWRELSVQTFFAPKPRWGHSAVYDPPRDRLIFFGGLDGNSTKSDVWALSLHGTPRWHQFAPDGGYWMNRLWASLVFDESEDQLVMYGGYGYSYLADAWAFQFPAVELQDLLGWRPLAASPERETVAALESDGGSPFTGSARLELHLGTRVNLEAKWLDVRGRVVERLDLGEYTAGRHSIRVSPPRRLSPGVYFVQVSGNRVRESQRVVVIR